MKKIKTIALFILLGLITFSCSKTTENTLDCIDVNYDEAFTIESNTQYCFPDGNSISTKILTNQFCPCDVVCIWEGEMIFNFEADFDGVPFTGMIRSSKQDFFNKQAEEYNTNISDINLVSPCSQSNPSPEIKNATIVVSK